ncbi:MAG: hypothetical protein ACQEP8_02770 [Chlamydiota bacterium]
MFLTLLFIFNSCTSSPPRWQFENLRGTHASDRSERIFFPASNPVTGLEVEFLRSSFGRQMYLNVFSRTIPPAKDKENLSLVSIVVNDQVQNFYAYRLQGGQRLLIPDYYQEYIIKSLSQGKEVTIKLQGFQETIPSANFPKAIDWLKDPANTSFQFSEIEFSLM